MDDPVVREMDVYLSKQLSGRLFLLQYPVRPAHMSYDDTDHVGVRVKPGQHRVEMELAVDTECPNYNARKGEEIAFNVDGNTSCDTSYFSTDTMNKQVLSSNLSGCDASRYLVGTMRQGEIHLTPLEAIVQLRPSFSYLDTADVRSEAAKAQQAADKADASHDDDEVKLVVPKFARHETDEAKARRVASFEYQKRKNDEESWVKLRYHNDRAVRSQNEKEKLFALDQAPLSSSEYLMSGEDYLQRILTTDKDVATVSASASLRSMHSLPLGDQIRTILQRVNVIRFMELVALLPQDSDVNSMLACLQQSADMVEGCWVVKSAIVYPKGSCSAYEKSLTAEVMCQARDYVLWKFSGGDRVMRQELAQVACLVREEEEKMLGEIGECCGREGWRFKLDRDTDFINSNAEVVERQMQRWELRGRTLATLRCQQPSEERGEETREKSPVTSRRPRTGSRTKSPTRQKARRRRQSSNRSELTDDDAAGVSDCSKKAMFVMRDIDLADDLATSNTSAIPVAHQNGSVNSSTASNIPAAVSLANHGSAANSSANHSTAPHPSANHGTASIPSANETAASEALMSGLCQFTSEKLSENHLLSVSELRDFLSIHRLQLNPGDVLATSVSDFVLDRALQTAGRKLNTSNVRGEVMYAFVNVGDGHDAIRGIVVDMLNVKSAVRTNLLKKQLDVQKLSCSDEQLKRILKEFCFTKGGSWILRNSKS